MMKVSGIQHLFGCCTITDVGCWVVAARPFSFSTSHLCLISISPAMTMQLQAVSAGSSKWDDFLDEPPPSASVPANSFGPYADHHHHHHHQPATRPAAAPSSLQNYNPSAGFPRTLSQCDPPYPTPAVAHQQRGHATPYLGTQQREVNSSSGLTHGNPPQGARTPPYNLTNANAAAVPPFAKPPAYHQQPSAAAYTAPSGTDAAARNLALNMSHREVPPMPAHRACADANKPPSAAQTSDGYGRVAGFLSPQAVNPEDDFPSFDLWDRPLSHDPRSSTHVRGGLNQGLSGPHPNLAGFKHAVHPHTTAPNQGANSIEHMRLHTVSSMLQGCSSSGPPQQAPSRRSDAVAQFLQDPVPSTSQQGNTCNATGNRQCTTSSSVHWASTFAAPGDHSSNQQGVGNRAGASATAAPRAIDPRPASDKWSNNSRKPASNHFLQSRASQVPPHEQAKQLCIDAMLTPSRNAGRSPACHINADEEDVPLAQRKRQQPQNLPGGNGETPASGPTGAKPPSKKQKVAASECRLLCNFQSNRSAGTFYLRSHLTVYCRFLPLFLTSRTLLPCYVCKTPSQTPAHTVSCSCRQGPHSQLGC